MNYSEEGCWVWPLDADMADQEDTINEADTMDKTAPVMEKTFEEILLDDVITFEGCNAQVEIAGFYWGPEKIGSDEPPDCVDIKVTIDAFTKTYSLTMDQLNAETLMNKCQLLDFGKPSNRWKFNTCIREVIAHKMQDQSTPKGYYFARAGSAWLPYENLIFVRGGEAIGRIDRPYRVALEICEMKLQSSGKSISDLLTILPTVPSKVLECIAYGSMTSIRSVLLKQGIHFQGILAIVGPAGVGKTTTATRIFGSYEEAGQVVGTIQIGSTMAAIQDKMLNLRDQPLILDDLCKSSSKRVERERLEKVAQVLRIASGDIPIQKKLGNTTVSLPNEAGIVLTAEYTPDNISDCNRLLLVHLHKTLSIPEELTPAQIGDLTRYYSEWFTRHWSKEIERFSRKIAEYQNNSFDKRICTNYACLDAAFESLLSALGDRGLTEKDRSKLQAKMQRAIHKSMQEHRKTITEIKARGDLAYYLWDGYKNKAFKLCNKDKIEKLKSDTYEGIIWNGDLCLKREALMKFFYNCPGCRERSERSILEEFKRMGALVVQEEGGYTVHLDKGLPRVCRFRLKVLKKNKGDY